MSPRSSNAEPQPNQPGSITRHCVQPKTHGIARRSSMRSDSWAPPTRRAGPRRRAAADVQRGDLADRRDRGEEGDELRLVVHERSVRRVGGGRQLVHRHSEPFGVAAEVVVDSRRRLQRGGEERLEVAPRRGRLGVLGRHHLALLGDADLPAHRSRRLGEDRLVGRSAAAADRSAAAVEQAQPHAVRLGDRDESRWAWNSAQFDVR